MRHAALPDGEGSNMLPCTVAAHEEQRLLHYWSPTASASISQARSFQHWLNTALLMPFHAAIQVQAAWHQGRESGQLYTALLLTHQMQTVAILCENIDIYSDGAASNSGNSSSSGTGCSSSSSGRCSGHSQRGRCMHLFDSHQHEYGDGQADGASVLTFASADMLCHFLQQRFPQVHSEGMVVGEKLFTCVSGCQPRPVITSLPAGEGCVSQNLRPSHI